MIELGNVVPEISTFIDEDLGSGDLTANIIPESLTAEAEVITRDAMVLCGQAWFAAVFHYLDQGIKINWQVEEGAFIGKNSLLCRISGSAKSMLTAERTGLNLLQTLSATATIARQYADAVYGTGCKILDTRKTIPGLRKAQKYAVACGGCYNHRMGLYDGILIKENHIMAAGSISQAVINARKLSSVPVEIEVENLHELAEALAAKPDRIMLDNFSLAEMRSAVKLVNGEVDLEASGNIDLNNCRAVAETGVNFISIGALTKNIQAIDLSMRIKLMKP
jgi:nicotinate-nucleotide pyrophosphorylase (carboxylating)